MLAIGVLVQALGACTGLPLTCHKCSIHCECSHMPHGTIMLSLARQTTC